MIVIDKQPQLQWLPIEAAAEHCARGAGVWQWAGTDDGTSDPDVVLACAGDVVTMETVAAAAILRERLPSLKVRVVNVVDLMTLPRRRDHPHGMNETQFAELFTESVDVVFAFHGYPGAVHQLVHGRPDADRFHVRGFVEEGTTTTPFDMVAKNRASRYHLVLDGINNAGRTPHGATDLKRWCEQKLAEHATYVLAHLEDMPEVRDWVLAGQRSLGTARGQGSNGGPRALPSGASHVDHEGMTQPECAADQLSRGECLALLPTAPFGRVVYTDGALPAVIPVNFLVDAAGIVIRTTPTSGLCRALDSSIVAFQADDVDVDRRAGWTVTVLGLARRVRDAVEITRLSELPLFPWVPGERNAFLVVEIGMVSGRRIGGPEPVHGTTQDELSPGVRQ